MFEVFPHGNGYRWRMISAEGRTLLEPAETHPCDRSAGEDAKGWRARFWAIASQVDHRMGAAI